MRNSLVNRAGWASALSMAVLATFGIGIATGMLATRLWPAAPETPARTLAEAKGEVERDTGRADRVSVLTAGAYLGAAATLTPTTELSARRKLQAIARPVQVAARAPTRPVVALATGSQARLAKAALTRVPEPAVAEVVVRRGDTLMVILQRAEVERAGALAAVESLREVYDPRRLRVGQALRITTAASDGKTPATLVALELALDLDQEIRVTRDGEGGFVAARLDRPQERRLVKRDGVITDSLYLSAERAAVPREVVVDLIRLFSWDVDFERDIRRGDRFEALFEEISLADGGDAGQVRGGDVLYGRLSLAGRDLEGFRFEHGDGKVDFYDRAGQSLRKFLLRTPIDGARTTSRFGMRRHPVLGYTKMHQGVDFAATTGTPIYAAGDGKVVVAKRNGGYGLYVKLRHTADYDTAYAHMSRIAKGIQPGRRVSQGQVIGYVGATGRITGPHLHYEVLLEGKQINPLSIEQPANVRLTGDDLDRFDREVARIDRLRIERAPGPQLASRVD